VPRVKSDVAMMARVADYLPSIGFIWPMVQCAGFWTHFYPARIGCCWNNTVKHVQSETIMGNVNVNTTLRWQL